MVGVARVLILVLVWSTNTKRPLASRARNHAWPRRWPRRRIRTTAARPSIQARTL